MIAGGSYSMWFFLEWIRKCMCDQHKKSHSLGIPFSGLGIFKRCYTIFWNNTCNELQFFQNFPDKPTKFSGVFTKAFLQPCCLFFFLEQTTNRRIDLLFQVLRYPAYFTGLELLPEPPKISFVSYYIQKIRLSHVSQ